MDVTTNNIVETGDCRRKHYFENQSSHEYVGPNKMMPCYETGYPSNLRKDVSLFPVEDGTKLFVQKWQLCVSPHQKPDGSQIEVNNPELLKRRSEPKAVLFFIHGYGSTSLYFSEQIIKNLCAQNFVVFAMDGRGHGLSDGLHTFIPDFDQYVRDYLLVYGRYAQVYPDKRKFLVSHSMGGAVSMKLSALDTEQLFAGCVFVSPLIRIRDNLMPSTFEWLLIRLASSLFPTRKMIYKSNLTQSIYTDQELQKKSLQYPLYYNDLPRFGTGYSMLRSCDEVEELFESFDKPFLLLHGKEDPLTCPEASIRFYDRAKSKDKNIRLFDGERHALLFENKAEEVFSSILQWINERI